MKLRNKRTGEIIDVYKGQVLIHYDQGRKTIHFKSLEDLEEWEDYEEPKRFYYITESGEVFYTAEPEDIEYYKEIGNYFETKEQAEKALEKLKAWKRLKDKGFRFCERDDSDIVIYAKVPTLKYDDSTRDALDLLFGDK